MWNTIELAIEDVLRLVALVLGAVLWVVAYSGGGVFEVAPRRVRDLGV